VQLINKGEKVFDWPEGYPGSKATGLVSSGRSKKAGVKKWGEGAKPVQVSDKEGMHKKEVAVESYRHGMVDQIFPT